MAQAQRFADQNLKTLMLCYNRTLSEWLESNLPEIYKNKITVTNFHRLCWRYCKDAGIPIKFTSNSEENFWKEKAAYLFMEAIEVLNKKYDAIVVDEGQDFYPSWWVPIDMLIREKNSPFYLFYDPAQNLFVTDGFTIPNLGQPIYLSTNCRNTQKIAQTCSRVRGIEIQVREDAPVGDNIIFEVAETSKKQLKFCRQIINEWISRGKLKPSQISIQSPNARKNSSMADTKEINGIPIIENLKKWEDNKGIYFSTIRSFKGLESDAVIIIDVPKPDSVPHFTKTDFYVACSRAKHLLVILSTSEYSEKICT